MTPTTADPVSTPPPAAARPVIGPETGWADPNFLTNRLAIPESELAPYYGQHVACTWDGTRILFGAKTSEELHDAVVRAGINPCHVAYDYVDIPGESYL